MAAFKNSSPAPSENLYSIDIFFEVVFGISIILEFLTDFIPDTG
jgi:hypothetical protein